MNINEMFLDYCGFWVVFHSFVTDLSDDMRKKLRELVSVAPWKELSLCGDQ